MSDVELRGGSEDSEDTPLIDSDEEGQPGSKPMQGPAASWRQGPVRTLGLIMLVQILYVFNDIARYIAALRLVSQGICREYHLENSPASIKPGGDIPEELCTAPAIQQRLATITGYTFAFEASLAFLLTIPYCLMVDRLSERLLAGINIMGFLMSCAWQVIVCFNWTAFPISMVMLAPIFSVIGGGSSVFDSVISMVVARNVSSARRSLYFSLFSAASLSTQIVSLTITSWLLDHGYLFTPMVLCFPVGLTALIALSLIRPDRQAQQNIASMGPISWAVFRNEVKSTATALSRLVANPMGLGLLATIPITKMSETTVEITILYVQQRFSVDFAYASRILTFQTIEGLILLVAILPLIKNISQNRYHIASTQVDLSITRVGFLLLSMGCLIMGLSRAWAFYIIGLMTFTLGWGTSPALKSVLTDLIPEEKIPALYTGIALCESMGMAVSSLLLNRSYAFALGWDNGRHLGLPFFIATFCFLFFGAAGTVLGKCRGR